MSSRGRRSSLTPRAVALAGAVAVLCVLAGVRGCSETDGAPGVTGDLPSPTSATLGEDPVLPVRPSTAAGTREEVGPSITVGRSAAAVTVRGSLSHADRRPAAGAAIHRVRRTERWPSQVARPESAVPAPTEEQRGSIQATPLGRTHEDGSFEVMLEPWLETDEWIEFDLGPAAVVRYRPEPDAAAEVLIVPSLLDTTFEVHGLDADERWSLELHPADRGLVDVECPSLGDLVLRCRFMSGDGSAQPSKVASLPDSVDWNVSVRAERHTIVDPARQIVAGERVVFRAGELEQRFQVQVVDVASVPVDIGGVVHFDAEKGWSSGEMRGGVARLEPPFGKSIEGDIRVGCVLDDGETFDVLWPAERWRTEPRLELRRGAGRAALTVDVETEVERVIAVTTTGETRSLSELEDGFFAGSGWWRWNSGRLLINSPGEVESAWCVVRSGAGEPARLGRATHRGAGDLRFSLVPGRFTGIANRTHAGPFRAVALETRLPSTLSVGEAHWILLEQRSGNAVAVPAAGYRADELRSRLRLVRTMATGEIETECVDVPWR